VRTRDGPLPRREGKRQASDRSRSQEKVAASGRSERRPPRLAMDGARHAGAAGMARAQEHPAHGSPYRACAGPVQELLALIRLRSATWKRAGSLLSFQFALLCQSPGFTPTASDGTNPDLPRQAYCETPSADRQIRYLPKAAMNPKIAIITRSRARMTPEMLISHGATESSRLSRQVT